jgi:prepilin-type N-terminal cleavage/methylation domain-containing protein
MEAKRGRRAFTLMELLVSLLVLAVMGGLVMALMLQALKTYHQGFAENTANDRAALALQVMLPQIREAVNIDFPGPQRIEFTLPSKGNDGRNYVNPATQALEPGLQVCYYISDGTGSMSVTDGRLLWRATKQFTETDFQPERVLAGMIDHLLITYAPSVDLLELVKVELTVGTTAGRGWHDRTIIGEVAMRNR